VTAHDELVGLLEALERAGTSAMALARAGRTPAPWTLYPDEYGIYDRRTRCQFYYHSHAGVEHTVHVVAISMAPSGWPQALFTVNLWAVGDAYASPEELTRHARAFRLRERRGPASLVRVINLVFQAFRPEIEWLQEEKERALAGYRSAHPGADPFEDRSLEILSRAAIDVRERGRRLLAGLGASA